MGVAAEAWKKLKSGLGTAAGAVADYSRPFVNRFRDRDQRVFNKDATRGYDADSLADLFRQAGAGSIEYTGKLPADELTTSSKSPRTVDTFESRKDKLKADTPAATNVRTSIEKALKKTQAFEAKCAEFKEQAKVLKALTEDPKITFLPSSGVEVLKSDGLKTLEDQHKEEIKQLEALFKPENSNYQEFTTNLKATLGESDLDSVKDEMIANLKAAQKKEKEAFEKEMQEIIKNMHQFEADRTKEIALLAKWSRDSKEMRDTLDEARRKKQQENEVGVELALGSSGKFTASFTGLKMSDLPHIKTKSGQTIKIGEDGKSMTIELPNHYLSSYHVSGEDHLKNDLLAMAEGIKRNPENKTIKWSIKINDSKAAMETARKAYEASRQAGFADDEISFMMEKVDEKGVKSMQEVKAAELFATCQDRLKACNAKADKQPKEWDEKLLQGMREDSTAMFRQELARSRAAAAAAAAPAIPPGQEQRPGRGTPGSTS